MINFLITLEKIIFYLINPFLWLWLEVMNRSENQILDKEKSDIKEKERKTYEKETGTKWDPVDNMNMFDYLYYFLFPLGFIILFLSFIFKFYYNLILIPVLEKNNLTDEQEIQLKKIKKRLILK